MKANNNNNIIIIKNIIPQTPSKLGVLQRKTFFHTLDETRSVGLAKACVLSKNLFCYREISFKITNIFIFVYLFKMFIFNLDHSGVCMGTMMLSRGSCYSHL